jgi:thymidine kinase
LRRALYARQRVEIYKPKIDTRYSELAIVSHSRQHLEAQPISQPTQIWDHLHPETDVVAVDEAQFMASDLVEVAQKLADQGLRVIAAGLDQDFTGKPFGIMPELLAVAEFVTKTLAICVVCGNPAGRSQRTRPEAEQVLIGAHDSYEPRCRRCHSLEQVRPSQQQLF